MSVSVRDRRLLLKPAVRARERERERERKGKGDRVCVREIECESVRNRRLLLKPAVRARERVRRGWGKGGREGEREKRGVLERGMCVCVCERERERELCVRACEGDGQIDRR